MYNEMNELKEASGGIVRILDDGKVEILDEEKVRGDFIDGLVRTAVFAEGEVRDAARWLIRRIAVALDSMPSSIQSLYEAMGKEEVEGFTVPAINIRGMTYDVARAVFRAAAKGRVGPVLFEIARSEIGYTMQRPAEYTTVVLAAAVRESFTGPIFLQGDHYQVNLKKYQADADKEVGAVKEIIRESIDAGFYNIDIDTSTLVDLDKPTIKEQQERALIDYHAEDLADLAVYVVNSWLLLRDARLDEGKREIANVYIAQTLPLMRAKAATLRNADPSLLEARTLILSPQS